MAYQILVVDDEKLIVKGIKFSLEQDGMEVTAAYDGEEALQNIKEKNFDLVVLDVMLPKMDGLEVCQQTREFSQVPIIMVTAKGEDMDKIMGLEYGADDYITKPFSVRELVARVNRVFLRRKSDDSSSAIHAGSISYDLDKKEARRAGQVIALSSLENRILDLLFTNHDKAVSRNAVLDCIWEATGNDVYDHTVTVYMKRIRAKLGEDVIKTVKGIGYRVDSSEAL